VTTNAHEMALAVVFETGIIHYADHYASYRSQRPEVKSFMSELPVTWTQTRLLSGDPSSYIVVARETDDAWYVAAINGQDKELELDLELSFLEAGSHEAFVITDNAKSKNLDVAE